MATGIIKLGVHKKLSRNPLSRGQLESFFYGGWVSRAGSLDRVQVPCKAASSAVRQCFTARQHLILQTLWLSGVCETHGQVAEWEVLCFVQRKPQQVQILPQPFQDNFLPVMRDRPFNLARMVNFWEKALCCTGWNRIHSTTKSRMNNKRGHHAGTAKLEQCPGSGDRLRPGTHNPLG